MFKDLVNKLNKVLKFSSEFKTEKVKDSDQVLEYSELVVGADVFVSGSTGSEVAKDGNYKLDSGVEFEVRDGKISEIKEEAPVEEVTEELAVEETEEDKVEDASASDREAELLKEIEDLKEEIKKLKSDFSSMPTKADLERFQTELTEEFKKLEAIPTQFSKTDNRIELTDSVDDKYKNLAKLFAKK
ncbi:hypothetical protein [Pedobacter agri]|uniref:hypothetical protein n=1 Tax=Pedobacter agri TaxID=454586 RepID=UPI00293103EE|nr:hypothetical protein [Pedobacter agri]